MTPIPKRLLIHSATLKRGQNDDGWGNLIGGTEYNLRHVRFEPTNKMITDSTGKQIQLSAIMFYDGHNSEGMGSGFQFNDEITFLDTKYHIAIAEPLYDVKLHHFEIGLI